VPRPRPGILPLTAESLAEMLSSTEMDAVAIATPVSTHHEMVMTALKADKHVLVEKPLAESTAHGEEMVQEAEQRGLVLMVDHTFIYTGAIRKIRELVNNGDIGSIYYYDSVRVNLGLFQHDVNVLWDLAVHDLSILDHIQPLSNCTVSATGMSHFEGQPENVAYLTLFMGNTIAHVHVNWLAPAKVRRTIIGGDKKMVVYDDLESSDKVKVYDKGITVSNNEQSIYDMLFGYRIGDMWSPNLDMTEALQEEVSHFAECIQNKTSPMTDGQSGLRVVSVLEAATASMKEKGKPHEAKVTRIT